MTARNFYKKIQHHTTMQKKIIFFGKTVTVDFFMNTEDRPGADKIVEWAAEDYYKALHNDRRLFFQIELYAPVKDQQTFVVNNVEYTRVSGTVYFPYDNNAQSIVIRARRTDDTNYSNDLSKSASEKFVSEFQNAIRVTPEDQDICRLEAWAQFIEYMTAKAEQLEEEAKNLRRIAKKLKNPNKATQTKWRTNGKLPEYCNNKFAAYHKAVNKGEQDYVEEIWSIRLNKLLKTIIHPTQF